MRDTKQELWCQNANFGHPGEIIRHMEKHAKLQTKMVDYITVKSFHFQNGHEALPVIFEEMKQALLCIYDHKVARWFKAMDFYDSGITEHTLRVTAITLALGYQIGLSLDDLRNIQFGSVLHDVGKLGIPDKIIQKPGKLSTSEFETIKMHPLYGFQWISRKSFFEPAQVIPLLHHERWDGSGYPYHLKGIEIPLIARLAAVADVWDATTSDRPYRKAMTKEAALNILINESGSHFDPDVVEAFFKLGIHEDLELDYVSILVD